MTQIFIKCKNKLTKNKAFYSVIRCLLLVLL